MSRTLANRNAAQTRAQVLFPVGKALQAGQSNGCRRSWGA